MTPELRAAIDQLHRSLHQADADGMRDDTPVLDIVGDPLTFGQLRTLLTAVDVDEPVFIAADCPHCPDGHRDPNTRPWAAYMSVYRDRDRQPTHLIVAPSSGGHVAESDAEWLRQVIRDAKARRHQPLTDEPCGVIPTPDGLDYLAMRRQQHPKADTDA